MYDSITEVLIKFFKSKKFIYICTGLVLATVVSPIILSWGSYMLKAFYKLPVNANATTILAGITGMWGSIVGGVIGGALTFFGVWFTIKHERNNNIKVHYQSQLGAAVFLALEVEYLNDRILLNKGAIKKYMERNLFGGFESRDVLYKGFVFLDKNQDWSPYIGKIQDVALQKLLWITYKKFKRTEAVIFRDISDLYIKEQEILSELPECFEEMLPEDLSRRQKFLVAQLMTLRFEIRIYKMQCEVEWDVFENDDTYPLKIINPLKTSLDKLVADIEATLRK